MLSTFQNQIKLVYGWADQQAQLIFATDQQGRKWVYHYIREPKSLLSWYIFCAYVCVWL